MRAAPRLSRRPPGERLLRLAIAASLLALVALLSLTVAVRAGMFAQGPIAGDLGGARSDRPGLRVLFIGNSITYVNDMPHLLTELVRSDPANRPIFAVRFTPPGQWLAQDVDDPRLASLLPSVHWDEVVLQEQSELQSLPPARRAQLSDVAAGALAARILEDGAQPVLFLTGGFPQGDTYNVPDDSFLAMQARLDSGYRSLGAELKAPVVPVGPAYQEAIGEQPATPLWIDDRHPTVEGAYLAACVFYAALYRRPATSTFTAGLEPAEARFLQHVATITVERDGTGTALR